MRRNETLLELLLVMAVMGLALGLGLPRIGAVRTAYLAAEEAREVAGFLRAARPCFVYMGSKYLCSK